MGRKSNCERTYVDIFFCTCHVLVEIQVGGMIMTRKAASRNFGVVGGHEPYRADRRPIGQSFDITKYDVGSHVLFPLYPVPPVDEACRPSTSIPSIIAIPREGRMFDVRISKIATSNTNNHGPLHSVPPSVGVVGMMRSCIWRCRNDSREQLTNSLRPISASSLSISYATYNECCAILHGAPFK